MKKSALSISLIDPRDNQQFLERIGELHTGSRALWGKMSVNQMLLHCLLPLELAAGERDMMVNRFLAFFGPISKRLFLKNPSFGKNLPTAPELVISFQPDFDITRQTLSAKVQHFGRQGISAYSTKPHPIFGAMTPTEWNQLQTKHLDHHLRQFGV